MPRNAPAGFAAAVVMLSASNALAQLVVTDPTSTAIQTQTLAQAVLQKMALGEQLVQLRGALTTAQQGLSIARDAYAGINQFQHFNADVFLQEGEAYFLAGTTAGQVVNFYADVHDNGLNGGHFDPGIAGRTADLFRDAARRAQAMTIQVPSIDALGAWSVAQGINSAIHDPLGQKVAMATPDPSTAAEGITAFQEWQLDPKLLALLVHQRQEAEQNARDAMKLYLESLGASPGKAAQLSASATTLSAVAIARLNDKSAQSLNLQQLERLEKSSAGAQTRKENDMMWNQVVDGLDSSYGKSPADATAPSLGDPK